MATRNIVPRANNEGSLGTEAKKWGDVQTTKLNGVDVTAALGLRQNSTAYAVGDVVYAPGLASKLRLVCTTAGTSAASSPDFSSAVEGNTITDGETLVWTVRLYAYNSQIEALQSVVNVLVNTSGDFERKYPIAAKGTAADKRNILVIPAMTVNINGTAYMLQSDAELDADASASWDSSSYATAANRAGKDFYIYACVPDSGTTPDFILSANSTVPTGYTEDTSRKLGGFHGECVAVGTITNHPLSGWAAGDILPTSVWDLKHRPIGEPEGYAYDEGTDMWYSIYGLSWSGSFGSATATMAGRAANDTLTLESKYGAEWADGASSEKWHCWKFEQILARQKQRLPYQREFVVASLGSNQGTNIYGSADPVTTGGHKDTGNRRMISNIGLEDCCGDHWIWGADVGAATTSGGTYADAFDANDKYCGGQVYGTVYRPLLGGHWDYAAYCGSRASYWAYGALALAAFSGARGASEPLYRRTI
jgi:hypothetical protein